MAADEHAPLLGGSRDVFIIPAAANLMKFRLAIGINVDASPDKTHDIESARKGSKPAPKSLYAEVTHLRRMKQVQYILIDILYYAIVVAQIVIGTILASLGPLSKLHSSAITYLGIVNASIAGLLALLKGQALPDRLRKDEFQLKKVQDFIEEEEIRLAIKGDITAEEVQQSVQKIFDQYNCARDTSEMNRPSSYAVQVEEPAGNGSAEEEERGKATKIGLGPANAGRRFRIQ